MFLTSGKSNGFNLYKSKNYYLLGKECDFIACYTAYKKLLYIYRRLFIKQSVKLVTKLRS